ncbi:hypothetical protein ACFL3Q_15820, partial [Planctomycetota bacterium]
ARKHGNLNLSTCGIGFFPDDVLGGSSRKNPGIEITINAEGIDQPIKTDIPTDRKTGKPRWIFRKRSWVKEFVSCHKLKPNDTVRINRIDDRTYQIVPENNQGGPQKQKIIEIRDNNQSTREERRVTIYKSSTMPPTKASEVTRDTPLEKLNLNWQERDLRERGQDTFMAFIRI